MVEEHPFNHEVPWVHPGWYLATTTNILTEGIPMVNTVSSQLHKKSLNLPIFTACFYSR